MKIECKCFRSKKTGRFFKFEEYCDDGYGKYRDSVSTYAFHENRSEIELPDLFPVDTSCRCFYKFTEHNKDEIEEVMVTITMEGIEHDK